MKISVPAVMFLSARLVSPLPRNETTRMLTGIYSDTMLPVDHLDCEQSLIRVEN